MNEFRVACEVWSTKVCEVSLTKNHQPREGWEKSGKILRKILRGYLCSRGMSVFMALTSVDSELRHVLVRNSGSVLPWVSTSSM